MALYCSALPVAATHPAWMATWKGVWTTAGTLAFMLVRGTRWDTGGWGELATSSGWGAHCQLCPRCEVTPLLTHRLLPS
jgi:hypothetical protein